MLRTYLKEHKAPNKDRRLLRGIVQKKNGFTTSCWGPALWHYWHTISLNFTTEKEEEYRRFEDSLQGTLPCASCRDNIADTLRSAREQDTPYKGRAHYMLFVYDVHDRINRMLGKSSPSFMVVVRKYESYRATSCSAMEKDGCKGSARIVIVDEEA